VNTSSSNSFFGVKSERESSADHARRGAHDHAAAASRSRSKLARRLPSELARQLAKIPACGGTGSMTLSTD